IGKGDELAHGAAAAEPAVMDGGDAGAVVAAVFQPLQRLEDERRHLVAAEDRDDAAHQWPVVSAFRARSRSMTRWPSPGFVAWWPRAMARAPSGTSAVMTDPAAT